MNLNEIKKWYIQHQKLYFASIELTQNCNFRCKHCYCPDKQISGMTLEQCKVIIDKLADTGCLFLNFTGGEIFTHRNFLDIYKYAKNKGFIIDLLTNASLIDEQIIEVFHELPPNNIAVTLYGTSKEEYEEFTGNAQNYSKVMKSLNLMYNAGIQFVLRAVATKTLYNSLIQRKFQKIAEDFKTSFRYDPIVFPMISGDMSPLSECLSTLEILKLEKTSHERVESWKELISNNLEYHWTCNAGMCSLAIDYMGNAHVCGLYREEPISILENDMDKVIEHIKSVHNNHIDIVNSNECSNCKNRAICKWCPAYAQIYNGNNSEKIKFFCQLAEKRRELFGK